MDAITSFFTWAANHWLPMAAFFLILWKGKELYTYFLLQPLRGGNGVVQMDEFAKYVLVLLLAYMIYQEGQTPETVYDTGVFVIMVVGIFLIAGVKEFAKVLDHYFTRK